MRTVLDAFAGGVANREWGHLDSKRALRVAALHNRELHMRPCLQQAEHAPNGQRL